MNQYSDGTLVQVGDSAIGANPSPIPPSAITIEVTKILANNEVEVRWTRLVTPTVSGQLPFMPLPPSSTAVVNASLLLKK